MTINKQITTSVLEQAKSATIIALVFALIGAYVGVQYQKRSMVQVNNKVVVTTPAEKVAPEASK